MIPIEQQRAENLPAGVLKRLFFFGSLNSHARARCRALVACVASAEVSVGAGDSSISCRSFSACACVAMEAVAKLAGGESHVTRADGEQDVAGAQAVAEGAGEMSTRAGPLRRASSRAEVSDDERRGDALDRLLAGGIDVGEEDDVGGAEGAGERFSEIAGTAEETGLKAAMMGRSGNG